MSDSISLPEVATVGAENALDVEIHMRGAPCGSGCPKSNVDQGQLTLSYYLN